MNLETFSQKETIISLLDSIQKLGSYQNSLFLQNLENDLLYEYEGILKCEEDFWKIKSRITWLTEGDTNTSFFYTSTINIRKKNRNGELQDVAGNSFVGEESISSHVLDHFF